MPVTETLSHTFVLNYLMVKLKVDINHAIHTMSCSYKQIFKVRPTLLELDGRTKIFRVGPILPEKMVRGTNFSSGNFGPRTIFSRTKIPVTGL